jgi:hypothetical protein
MNVAGQGMVLAVFSGESERMAYALVKSLRRVNSVLPVTVLAQGYAGVLDWRGLAALRMVPAAAGRGEPERRWLNKPAAMARSPYKETLFMDCDVVFMRDPALWFDRLGTDDFTFFHRMLTSADLPEEMTWNVVNPRRMMERYGVEEVPIIEGGGHYFFRRTARGRQMMERLVAWMEDSAERGEASDFAWLAGPGNLVAADEIAASIVAVKEGLRLPPPGPRGELAVGVFLPQFQKEEAFDLEAGMASFFCPWAGQRVSPDAVHFCHTSKNHEAYRAFVEKMVAEGPLPIARTRSEVS